MYNYHFTGLCRDFNPENNWDVTVCDLNYNNENNNLKIIVIFPKYYINLFLNMLFVRALEDYLQLRSKPKIAHW